MRVSDADRDGCVAVLIDHHLTGRLSLEELERRQEAAMTAVTGRDLEFLLSDLPDGKPTRIFPSAGSTVDAATNRVTAGARRLWPVGVIWTGAFVAQGGSSADWWHLNDSIAAGFIMASFGYATHWAVTKVRSRP
jgi:hypothetical protein